ncbi:NfeD family protein [Gimesia alba]|uniref:NfeD family protein n=1 Tax=Gimesia alba TaxID=2527973 RepID=UPI0021BC8323|nr:NfeD family protein [Gimesia alba]
MLRISPSELRAVRIKGSGLNYSGPDPLNLCQIDTELSPYLGKEAPAVSTLSPQGDVQFEDQRLEAASASGAMISAGTKLKVIGIQDRKLLVAEQIELENTPVN